MLVHRPIVPDDDDVAWQMRGVGLDYCTVEGLGMLNFAFVIAAVRHVMVTVIALLPAWHFVCITTDRTTKIYETGALTCTHARLATIICFGRLFTGLMV